MISYMHWDLLFLETEEDLPIYPPRRYLLQRERIENVPRLANLVCVVTENGFVGRIERTPRGLTADREIRPSC